MLAINLSDLGTGGLIGATVLIFVAIGFAKGMVRMAFGLVALSAGILAGLWGFQKGAAIAGFVIAKPEPWMSAAVGIILGLAIFFVARMLFGVLLSPVRITEGKERKQAFPGGLLGFIMGIAFAWFMLSGIRYIGTLAELQWIQASIADKTKVQKLAQPLFAKIKRAIDSSSPGQMHEKFDFLNDRARANLAKLSLLADSPVAITTAMATDKEVRQAILQIKINEMLEQQSADLRPYIEESQFSHLLQSKQIKTATANKEVAAALQDIDVEKALGLLEEPKKDDKKKDPKDKK